MPTAALPTEDELRAAFGATTAPAKKPLAAPLPTEEELRAAFGTSAKPPAAAPPRPAGGAPVLPFAPPSSAPPPGFPPVLSIPSEPGSVPAMRSTLDLREKGLKQDAATLARLRADLDRQKALMHSGKATKEQVDAYNAQVQQLNQATGTYRGNFQAYQVGANAYNTAPPPAGLIPKIGNFQYQPHPAEAHFEEVQQLLQRRMPKGGRVLSQQGGMELRQQQKMAVAQLGAALPKMTSEVEAGAQHLNHLAIQLQQADAAAKRGELSPRGVAALNKQKDALAAGIKIQQGRAAKILGYQKRFQAFQTTQGDEPLFETFALSGESPRGGLDPASRAIFHLLTPRGAEAADKAQRIENGMKMRGEIPPLPPPPDLSPAGRQSAALKRNAVVDYLTRPLPGHGFGAERPAGMAIEPQVWASWDPWMRKIAPIIQQQIAGRQKAAKLAQVERAGQADVLATGAAVALGGVGAGMAGHLEGWATRFLPREAARILASMTTAGVGGATGAGGMTTTSALVMGKKPKEALQEGARAMPAGFVLGAAVGAGHALTRSLLEKAESAFRSGWHPEQGPQAVERIVAEATAGGVPEAQAPRLRELLTKLGQTPRAARGPILKTIRGEFSETLGYGPRGPAKGAGAPRPRAVRPEVIPPEPKPVRVPTARAPGPVVEAQPEPPPTREAAPEQHEARALQMSGEVPPGSRDAHVRAWTAQGSPAREHHDALTTAAAQVAQTNPQLAEKLREAAQTTLSEFNYQHRHEHLAGDQLLDEPPAVAPPQVSVWRRLSEPERKTLSPAVRRSLLVQDVSNSHQVLDPETMPAFAVPGVKSERALQAEADRLFAAAQQTHAAQGEILGPMDQHGNHPEDYESGDFHVPSFEEQQLNHIAETPIPAGAPPVTIDAATGQAVTGAPPGHEIRGLQDAPDVDEGLFLRAEALVTTHPATSQVVTPEYLAHELEIPLPVAEQLHGVLRQNVSFNSAPSSHVITHRQDPVTGKTVMDSVPREQPPATMPVEAPQPPAIAPEVPQVAAAPATVQETPTPEVTAPTAELETRKQPYQMTRQEFEATGTDVLHGTSRPFEKFDAKARSNKFSTRGGFFFTGDPRVAQTFADDGGRREGISAGSISEAMHRMSGLGNLPDIVPDIEETGLTYDGMIAIAKRRMEEGRGVYYYDDDGHLQPLTSVDDLPENYDTDTGLMIYPRGQAPRVISTKVFGDTLDLRRGSEWPRGLVKRLEESKNFWDRRLLDQYQAVMGEAKRLGDTKRDEVHGAWQFIPNSPAVQEYAMEHGIGKVRLKDAYESGFQSIYAPDVSWIGYGQDPHKAFVIKALAEGRTVPETVLAEYPDVQKWLADLKGIGKTGGPRALKAGQALAAGVKAGAAKVRAKVDAKVPEVAKPQALPAPKTEAKPRAKKAEPAAAPAKVEPAAPPAPIAEKKPSRVKFNRGKIDEAIDAAKRLKSDQPVYVFGARSGYTFGAEPPPGGQAYTVVQPGGAVKVVESETSLRGRYDELARAVATAGKEFDFAKNLLVAAKHKTGNTGPVTRAQREVSVRKAAGRLAEHVTGLIEGAEAAGLMPREIAAAAEKAGVILPAKRQQAPEEQQRSGGKLAVPARMQDMERVEEGVYNLHQPGVRSRDVSRWMREAAPHFKRAFDIMAGRVFTPAERGSIERVGLMTVQTAQGGDALGLNLRLPDGRQMIFANPFRQAGKGANTYREPVVGMQDTADNLARSLAAVTVHEMAHFKVRVEGAPLWEEMDRLNDLIEKEHFERAVDVIRRSFTKGGTDDFSPEYRKARDGYLGGQGESRGSSAFGDVLWSAGAGPPGQERGRAAVQGREGGAGPDRGEARQVARQEQQRAGTPPEEGVQRVQEVYEAGKGPHPKPEQDALTKEARNLYNRATRVLQYLPRGPEHAELTNRLLRLQKGTDIADMEAQLALLDMGRGLTPPQKEAFQYGRFVRDMASEVKVQEERIAQSGEGELRLPNNLSKADVEAASADLAAQLAKPENKAAVEALERRRDIINRITGDYRKSRVELTGSAPTMDREDWMHHEILKHLVLQGKSVNWGGKGEGLHTPGEFGATLMRRGSVELYNSDWASAEHKVLARMIYDTHVYDFLNFVVKEYDLANSADLKAQARKEGKRLDEVVPEGYGVYQPEVGSHFFKAWSLPDRLSEDLFVKGLTEVGVTEKDLRQVLAMGQPMKQYILPTRVIRTLNEFNPRTPDDLEKQYKQLRGKVVGFWKQTRLVGPSHFIGYNLRNEVGDLEAILFAMGPAGLKNMGRAASELSSFFWKNRRAKNEITPELRQWVKRGGLQTVLQSAEQVGGSGLALLQGLAREGEKGNWAVEPFKKTWNFYWNHARSATDLRESIGRYAVYLNVLEEIQKHGRPVKYRASIPAEIKAIKDPRDQAFKISNELLGAYDQVSQLGQMTAGWIPFWRWNEANWNRNRQLFDNHLRGAGDPGERPPDEPGVPPWKNKRLLDYLGRKTLGSLVRLLHPFSVAAITAFVVKAHLLEAGLRTWNAANFPQALPFIPERDRGRPIFIYSYDPETHRVGYTTRLGVFADTKSFIGGDNLFGLWEKWANGHWSKEEVARQAAGALLGKFVAFGPQQTGLELLTGKRLYPDPLNPTPIRDHAEYFWDQVDPMFGNVYRYNQGRAQKPGQYRAFFGGREVDLDESAYDDMRSYAGDFLASKDKGGRTSDYTDKANALYYHKQALRWGDMQAASRYLLDYVMKGGDDKGRQASLKTLDPLAGADIGGDLQSAFVKTLAPVEQERLRRAYLFLDELVRTGTTQPAGTLPAEKLPLDRWLTTMRDRIESEIMFQEPVYDLSRKSPEARKALEQKEMAPR